MKAIAPALIAALVLAGCAAKPAPKPAPAPQAPPVVLPRPAQPSAPIAIRPPTADWRDERRTVGNWSWQREGALSVARYGTQFALSCDASARQVTISLGLRASASQPIFITATDLRRALNGQPQGALLIAILPPSDPLLDAMAFSRGRFMVETGSMAPFYLPSWAEVSRVIEDCR